MDQRGMTRNELANSIHTRFEVVDKWYRGDISKIDLDILARICYVMECRVEELLIYEAP
ncbi:helix-turn-helix transcriptional regulator [Oscillibacter sp. MSJ-2]|uniref:Helix-turn-helix transcriptional regulator n=2 Tax=Dysosmobacter acutus TaxID=2841504 RepID=A0ABS6F646_9FIRM|nr:helix-turn-helix transcriptional regulator [Dysosmobacter acutus]